MGAIVRRSQTRFFVTTKQNVQRQIRCFPQQRAMHSELIRGARDVFRLHSLAHQNSRKPEKNVLPDASGTLACRSLSRWRLAAPYRYTRVSLFLKDRMNELRKLHNCFFICNSALYTSTLLCPRESASLAVTPSVCVFVPPVAVGNNFRKQFFHVRARNNGNFLLWGNLFG